MQRRRTLACHVTFVDNTGGIFMRKVLVVAAIVAMVTALTSANAQRAMSGTFWLEKCSGAELLSCVSFLQGMDAMYGLKVSHSIVCRKV